MKQFRHYFTITKGNKTTDRYQSFANHNKATLYLYRLVHQYENAMIFDWNVWNDNENADVILKDGDEMITVSMRYFEGVA